MRDALAELEKWHRKYYNAKIVLGPSMQPGDGAYIELNGGGRTVTVDECEWMTDDDEPTNWPTISDMILRALDKWNDDETDKYYHVLAHSSTILVLDKPPSDIKTKTLLDGRHGDFYLIAKNDDEAMGVVRKLIRSEDYKLYCWEIGPTNYDYHTKGIA